MPLEQEPSGEQISTGQAVWQLKSAQSYLLVSPMEWYSEDEEYRYTAIPFESPEQQPVDLALLPEMPMWQFDTVLNVWELGRMAKPDVNGDVALDRYVIAPGAPLLHTSHLVPNKLIEDADAEKITEVLHASSTLQNEVGLSNSSPEDYESLSDAISTLKIITDAAREEKWHRKASMTDEEKRWERMQKYHWLVTPEMDRSGPPKWWGVSEGGLLWAVQSATPDEAIIMIEDARDGLEIFPLFFVEEYPEEIQEEFDETLNESKVVRLIPFSKEPWPESQDDMTQAQSDAIEHLKEFNESD